MAQSSSVNVGIWIFSLAYVALFVTFIVAILQP